MPTVKKLSRKQKIEAVVSDVIAEHGFCDAFNSLEITLNWLGAASLADPDNSIKEREFLMWSQAIKNAFLRQTDGTAFHERVTATDALYAHGMGISLV